MKVPARFSSSLAPPAETWPPVSGWINGFVRRRFEVKASSSGGAERVLGLSCAMDPRPLLIS